MRFPTHIPRLSGRWLAIFRGVWLVGFVAALVGATWGVAASHKQNHEFNQAIYRIGLTFRVTDDGRKVSPLDAQPKRVAPESTIVAIDGKPWPAEVSSAERRAFTTALGGPDGTVHRLLLRDPRGAQRVVALTVSQANLDAFDARAPMPLAARARFYAVTQGVIAALSLLAALILFVKRAREPVVALLAIGFLVPYWQLAIALVDGPSSDLLARLSLSNLVLGTGLALFPSGKFEPRWTLLVILLQIVAYAAMVGGLLISLLRYRLYDADTVLSRSAVYGMLALAMIAVFAGTEKLVEILADEYWGGSLGAAAGAIAAGIAATVIPLFHRRLERWAERHFQGPLIALRDDLPDDLRDWRETGDPAALARDALARVTAALRSRGGAIVARGAPRQILASRDIDKDALTEWLAVPHTAEIDRTDPLLPLRIPLGPLPGGGDGFLLLGPRPDGTAPGKDEREAAASIADPLGRALSVAQRKQASDRAVRKALAALGKRIAAIEVGPAPA